MIKKLVEMIEEATGEKVNDWELGKIYTAFNSNGEVLAQYNPKSEKLTIIRR